MIQPSFPTAELMNDRCRILLWGGGGLRLFPLVTAGHRVKLRVQDRPIYIQAAETSPAHDFCGGFLLFFLNPVKMQRMPEEECVGGSVCTSVCVCVCSDSSQTCRKKREYTRELQTMAEVGTAGLAKKKVGLIIVKN